MAGLLPPRLAGSSLKHLRRSSASDVVPASPLSVASLGPVHAKFPGSASPFADEEAMLGLPGSASLPHRAGLGSGLRSPSPSHASLRSHQSEAPRSPLSRFRPHFTHPLKRRPTAVRVVVPDEYRDHEGSAEDHEREDRTHHASLHGTSRANATERTPLIKAGVKPDYRNSVDETQAMAVMRRAEVGLGRMVELGLPLIMCGALPVDVMCADDSAHEISRTLFKFRRMGCIEAVGPAVRGCCVADRLMVGPEHYAGASEWHDGPAGSDGARCVSRLQETPRHQQVALTPGKRPCRTSSLCT